LIIIQLIEFYIISKPIYRREILVKKVNIILIVIANLFLVAIVLVEKVNIILVVIVNLFLVAIVNLILKRKRLQNKLKLFISFMSCISLPFLKRTRP
jgi:D-alanyl-lipoteichoic acid acyltransferase DltB (MBOAT superfamily)